MEIMSIIFMTDLDGTLLGHDDFSCGVIREDLLGLIRTSKSSLFQQDKAEIDLFCQSQASGCPSSAEWCRLFQ